MSMRVVSLVPSLTEVLCAVGGRELLVGRNHEDDYPPEITDRPILTRQKITFTTSQDVDRQVSESLSNGQSLYHLDVTLLKDLKPDVILTQDLCSVCAIDLNTVRKAAKEMQPIPKIASLNPQSFEEVLDSVKIVANAVGLTESGNLYHAKLKERIQKAKKIVEEKCSSTRPKVAFIEWSDPIFVGGHWTPELIELAGGFDGLNKPGHASFKVPSSAIVSYQPDILILCPCGINLVDTQKEFDLMKKQDWWNQIKPHLKKVALVDGNQMFNRPGPRLVDALEWLTEYFHLDNEYISKDFPYIDIKDWD